MPAFKLILLGFLALLGALPAAHAQGTGFPTVTVIEYFHPGNGRFYMSADPIEQQMWDTVELGRVRTGLQFDAIAPDVEACITSASGVTTCAVPVRRFNYAFHDWPYYTVIPAEWDQLRAADSGFIEAATVPFQAFAPGAGGTCPPGRVQVFRSYKNQNHRFPPDSAAHQRQVSTGSLNEGVAFCAERARTGPIFEAAFAVGPRSGTMTDLECRLAEPPEGCVVTRNLQTPRFLEGGSDPEAAPEAFVDRSGYNGRYIFTMGDGRESDRALGTFAQFGDTGQVGLHVNAGNRLLQGQAGLDIVHTLQQRLAFGVEDNGFFPFGKPRDVPVELSMRFTVFVKSADLGSGNLLGGRLRISFLDVAERRLLHVTEQRQLDLVVNLYGDRFPGTDTVTREAVTFTDIGKITVTTSIERTSYGREANGAQFLFVPGFHRFMVPGIGGSYDYRIDQAALQRIVNAAFEMDRTFSLDLTRYAVIGYRIENDVEGDGRLGLNARDVKLQLLRR